MIPGTHYKISLKGLSLRWHFVWVSLGGGMLFSFDSESEARAKPNNDVATE